VDWDSLRFAYLRRVVGTGFTVIGLERSRAIARAMARGVYDLNTPGRRLAEERVRAALGPTISNEQRDAIVKTSYEHIAQFWIETLFVPRKLKSDTWARAVTFRGETRLREFAAANPRCVLATCYFGNPAVAAFALGQIFRPVHVLVDYVAQPAARAWQEQLCRMPNVVPMAASEGARQMRDLMRGRGAVMMVVEHRRRQGTGAPAWFLGQHGNYHATPGRLSVRYGAPVLPVLCRRRPGTFEFELWVGRAVAGDDAVATTSDVLRQLDAQIRHWPEQYLWMIPPDLEGMSVADARGVY